MLKQTVLILALVAGLVAAGETTSEKEEQSDNNEPQVVVNNIVNNIQHAEDVAKSVEDEARAAGNELFEKASGVTGELKNLGSLVGKHGLALAKDAEPSLNNIKREGGKLVQKEWGKVMENEQARKVVKEGMKRYEQIKPHAKKAMGRLMSESKKKLEKHRPVFEQKTAEYTRRSKEILERMVSKGKERYNRNKPAKVEVNEETVEAKAEESEVNAN